MNYQGFKTVTKSWDDCTGLRFGLPALSAKYVRETTTLIDSIDRCILDKNLCQRLDDIRNKFVSLNVIKPDDKKWLEYRHMLQKIYTR